MKQNKILFSSVLLLLCLGILSCSGSLFRNYGSIRPAGGDSRDLTSGLVRPELRYYTSGPDLFPNALIGLHRDHRLAPDTLWKEIQPISSGKLRELVGHMNAKASQHRTYLHEFDLLDTGGKKIGFWYSILAARTFLRMEKDGTVMLPTPDLETYKEPQAEADDKTN